MALAFCGGAAVAQTTPAGTAVPASVVDDDPGLPIRWALAADYVGAGDLDADEGAPLAENRSNLSASLFHESVYGDGGKFKVSFRAKLADDYSKKNDNGGSLGAGLEVKAPLQVLGFRPLASAAWAQNRKAFLGRYDRDELIAGIGASATFPLRKDCSWLKTENDAPEPSCLVLELNPTLSRTWSSSEAYENRTASLSASVVGMALWGVQAKVEGVILRREYAHNLSGLDFARDDDQLQAYGGVNLGDVLRDVSALDKLWLGLRWARQETNSPDPTHRYDQVQLVLSMTFGGAVRGFSR